MSVTNTDNRPTVAVYGSSVTGQDEPAYAQAVEAGRLLAMAGARVACGGYGGVMEAVSRGASEAGGEVVGFTVRSFQGRSPNPYLSQEVPCEDLYQRLANLIDGADALVAMGGGIGTLVEVFLAWNALYMGLIEPRPLILVGGLWETALAGLSEAMEITDSHMDHVSLVAGPAEAVALLADRRVLA